MPLYCRKHWRAIRLLQAITNLMSASTPLCEQRRAMTMTRYSLEPLIGVRPVLLGMTRAESRKQMGATPVSFKKAPRLFPNKPEVDAYHGNAFQLFFDENGRVEFIELSKSPDLSVNYYGTDVFALRADDLVALISRDAAFDPNVPDLGYSYIFPLLEMSVWRPTIPDTEVTNPERATFATVGVGTKGYFSNVLHT